MVELPWAADGFPCVEKLRTVLTVRVVGGQQRKQAVAGDEEKIFPLMIDADSTRPPASPPGILPVRLIPPPRVCVRSSRREGPYEALLDRESLVKRRPTRMKIQYNA